MSRRCGSRAVWTWLLQLGAHLAERCRWTVGPDRRPHRILPQTLARGVAGRSGRTAVPTAARHGGTRGARDCSATEAGRRSARRYSRTVGSPRGLAGGSHGTLDAASSPVLPPGVWSLESTVAPPARRQRRGVAGRVGSTGVPTATRRGRQARRAADPERGLDGQATYSPVAPTPVTGGLHHDRGTFHTEVCRARYGRGF